MSGAELNKMKMKLFIDNMSNRVLYAEAGKDCVDFLLHVFAMPLGSAMRLLLNGATLGDGLSNLYSSMTDLSIDYSKTTTSSTTSDDKLCLLNPDYCEISKWGSYSLSLSSQYTWYLSDCEFGYGPQSQRSFDNKNPSTLRSDCGYVKEQVAYMITDDFSIKPLSTTTTIALLSQFDVKNLGCIQETEVAIDTRLGMELLKLSLVSNTVLTDAFLGKIGK